MPVNFKDFYNYATSANFGRSDAIVLTNDSTTKFKVSDSDHSWSIMRSSDDKKLNNDIRNAFYNAVSEQCGGNIPKSVLSALNLRDYKRDTDGNATSGKPLTAYRMQQVFTAMKNEGIEMPRLSLDDFPVMEQNDADDSISLDNSIVGNDKMNMSDVLKKLDEDEGQVKNIDIAKEDKSNQVQKGASEQKPKISREQKYLLTFLGGNTIDDVLKTVPEKMRGKAKEEIENALIIRNDGDIEDVLMQVCRDLNKMKFIDVFNNSEDLNAYLDYKLYDQYQNNQKATSNFKTMASDLAKEFAKEWIGKDGVYPNKPLKREFLENKFVEFFEKRGPEVEEDYDLMGKINWDNEISWE